MNPEIRLKITYCNDIPILRVKNSFSLRILATDVSMGPVCSAGRGGQLHSEAEQLISKISTVFGNKLSLEVTQKLKRMQQGGMVDFLGKFCQFLHRAQPLGQEK